MRNLLEETLDCLKENGKTFDDVVWIGSDEYEVTKEDFLRVADVNYDSGYGGQNVATNLMLVGNGWWLTRGEYDGSEWWDYHEQNKRPTKKLELHALTISQALGAGFDVSCGWVSLEGMNGVMNDN